MLKTVPKRQYFAGFNTLTQSDFIHHPLPHPSHDGNGFCREESWVPNFFVDDAVKHLLFVITWEWRLQHTQAHNKQSE